MATMNGTLSFVNLKTPGRSGDHAVSVRCGDSRVTAWVGKTHAVQLDGLLAKARAAGKDILIRMAGSFPARVIRDAETGEEAPAVYRGVSELTLRAPAPGQEASISVTGLADRKPVAVEIAGDLGL